MLVCPCPGAHFWALPSLLFQEPIKAKAGHSQPIKNSNCVYRASTSRGPIKSENTPSTWPEIRGYRVEEFWIMPWLVISVGTHGLSQSNTAAKSPMSWTRTWKKPTKPPCAQKKTQQIIFRAAFWLLPWEAVASPHTCSFWWISCWGNSIFECFQLQSCPLLVLPGSHWNSAEGGYWTSSSWIPSPEADPALKCSLQDRAQLRAIYV